MADNKKILLFNIDSSKATLIKSLCGGMGIQPIVIYKNQYGEKIGALVGLNGFAPSMTVYSGDDIAGEMMIFCGFSSDELDEFLERYRESKIPPISLKAMVTPHNISWSAVELYRELTQEHKFFHSK